MEKILISIITPMYNCENYISRCIDSLLKQSYKNVEIVLVDDGSKDKTLDIVQGYNDYRIKIFKKENGGASSARNYGIEKSKGDYILFVDSDDYVHKDIIKLMAEKINTKSDTMVFANNYELYIDNQCERILFNTFKEDKGICKEGAMREIASGRAGLVCCKLIPKNIITKYNIRFSENIKISEDQLFFLEVAQYIDEFRHVRQSLYYYDRRNENSITIKYDETIYKTQMQVLNLIRNIFIKNDMNHKEDLRALSAKQKDIIFSCISNEIEKCNIINFKNTFNNIKKIISNASIEEDFKEYMYDSKMGQLIYRSVNSDKYILSTLNIFVTFKLLLRLKK